ncbi:DMT family transporter [Nisaea acidiphila]|uniref:DMT family transporter n=1 Tax=Nisaea acidiphila TaxID=1862145 RepID=A0A9J7ANI0_9PROT|nr:DMT family transporter [Nisaea acidiphila]UUX49195.1 DMT family transporter [Nisaea acidiphila]
MVKPNPSETSGIPAFAVFLLAMLALLWGLNWPVMKLSLAEYPPFVFRAVAGLSAALGLFAMARAGGRSLLVPRAEWKGLVIVSILNMSVWNIAVLYGVDLMESGRAAILAYTMPLWASLTGAWLVKERLSGRSMLALALGLVGMGLLFFGDDRALMGGPLGPGLVVLAAVAWGSGTAAVKYFRFTMPVTVLTGWQQLIGAVPIAVIAAVWDYQHMPDSVTLWPTLGLVYNMTITGIFCYWAYFNVVTMLPVVVSTVGTLMVPVMGVVFDALIFGTVPGPVDYAALAAVVSAVFLVMTRRAR